MLVGLYRLWFGWKGCSLPTWVPSRSARPGGEGDPLGKPLGVGEPRNIPVGFKVLRGFILSLILVLHRDKLRQAEALNQADQLNQSRSI